MSQPKRILLVLTDIARHAESERIHEQNLAVWHSDGLDVHVHLLQRAVELILGGDCRLQLPAGARLTVDPMSLAARGVAGSELPKAAELLDMDGLVAAFRRTGDPTAVVLAMKRRWFLNVMGTSFQSEDITTLFRMTDSLLRSEHEVAVWTCGGATLLTLASLTDAKPDDLFEVFAETKSANAPTTARLVAALLAKWPHHCQWFVCRHCAQERGALEHVSGVKMLSSLGFRKQQRAADLTLMLGRK